MKVDNDFVFSVGVHSIDINITLINNHVAERRTEGFTVSISHVVGDSNHVVLQRDQATITIREDDCKLLTSGVFKGICGWHSKLI